MGAHTDTVHGMLEQTAARSPSGDAAVFPGSRTDYAGLVRATTLAASRMRGLGLGPGECVGLVVPAGVSQVALLLGAMRLGALPVPLNGRMKPSELEYLVHHSGMRFLLCDETAAALAAQVPMDGCQTIRVSDTGEFDAELPAADPDEVERLAAAVKPDDPSIILYTSGTTSRPKGVVHTHLSLVAEGRNIAERLGMNDTDRFWSPLPMFHCGGIVTMLGAFASGAAFCHVGNFEAGIALDQLEQERCTLAFPAFETIWLAILDHPRFAAADLSPLRTVINVGVRERLRAMQERLPTTTQISSFGLTESCGFMCIGLRTDPLDSRISTSGRPLPGMEVRAVDPETGNDAECNEIGEAVFRGVSRFSHYHRDAEYTAQTIDPDGFFHSGDLIRIDEQGRLSFVGRLKDMLKVGGENVSAAEVEDLLASHPAVKIVQVVAAPDARLGEVACAFIELQNGASATERELIEHCLGKISTFKVPRYVRFVPGWPMSGTKIQKFRLRETIATELREAGITEAPKLRSTAGAVQ